MPRLSDGMEEGTVVRWLVEAGATVGIGHDLCEIETDKVTMVYESPASGAVAPVVAAGETVPVGAPIAELRAPAEPTVPDDGRAARAAVLETDDLPIPREERLTSLVRPRATPLARRLARERGLDLAGVPGSGPDLRITRADVLAVVDGTGAETGADVAPPASAERESGRAPTEPRRVARSTSEGCDARGATERVDATRLQRAVARRMSEAKAEAPDFMVALEASMDAALALREELRDLGPARPLPSLNDMVVKAAGLALREVPEANASWHDGAFHRYDRVNVGVAVSAPGALVVPTVFDADRRTLHEIAVETRRLAEAVRRGSMQPGDLDGGTFTVSNIGMLGIRRFTPILNPPQAAILGVGACEPRPVVRDGALAVGNTMELTLTCDHRVLYGEQAARLLASIRRHLERPLLLLVG